MKKKLLFVIYDVEHDEDLRNRIMGDSQKPDSTFDVADWSVKEPIAVNSREMLRKRLGRVDVAVVICGEHTDQSAAVSEELAVAQALPKPNFLLLGRSTATSKKPANAKDGDKIYGWTSTGLKSLLDGVR